ncbi:CBS domain-containing protein [Oxynema sp. CENA135]|uniref:CBS domain-containing protein n=1 Tax=Oxynema sp. CENA135 TaxID=984206 RepID=UPI00190AA08E|nr:CBS domain-containing protein [Oxynema sp. CENA135]MBK4729064.1 CBS domain-containing protein [Oxynema sp. CENA135]
MSLNPSVLESLSLEQAIERDPLTVSPDRPIVEVVALMSEVRDGTCTLEDEWEKTLSAGFPLEGEIATGNTYILVVEGARLVGIVTESDLVKLASRAIPLAQLTVADVMSADPIALEWSERRNLFDIVQLFRQHAITHVPIVDGRSQLLGVVTAAQIRRVLQPSNLLRFQEVRDVMNPEVICASPTTSIREIAELMVRRRIGCVTIAEEQNGHLIPLGIVTQRDVIQFQSLELDLESLSAQTVMSAPAIAVSPHDSLWDAHQITIERRIRRLLVVGASGELLGIVTQTRLLQVLDPVQMYRVIEVLHEQVLHLEAQKVELLRDRAADLEEKVRQRTSKLRDRVRREALLAGVASRIRESLNLQEILDSTAREVRRFLDCNRVLVYQFAPNMEGEIVAESVSEGCLSILGEQIRDTYFQTNGSLEYLNGRKRSVNDIYQAGLTGCHVELLEQFQVRS